MKAVWPGLAQRQSHGDPGAAGQILGACRSAMGLRDSLNDG
jgi:hypothetical protein